MSFISSIFGGGGDGGAAALGRQMIEQQNAAAADAGRERDRLRNERNAEQAKADTEAAQEETRRVGRLRGVGSLMTHGFAGYGDSRTLGTPYTLGT